MNKLVFFACLLVLVGHCLANADIDLLNGYRKEFDASNHDNDYVRDMLEYIDDMVLYERAKSRFSALPDQDVLLKVAVSSMAARIQQIEHAIKDRHSTIVAKALTFARQEPEFDLEALKNRCFLRMLLTLERNTLTLWKKIYILATKFKNVLGMKELMRRIIGERGWVPLGDNGFNNALRRGSSQQMMSKIYEIDVSHLYDILINNAANYPRQNSHDPENVLPYATPEQVNQWVKSTVDGFYTKLVDSYTQEALQAIGSSLEGWESVEPAQLNVFAAEVVVDAKDSKKDDEEKKDKKYRAPAKRTYTKDEEDRMKLLINAIRD